MLTGNGSTEISTVDALKAIARLPERAIKNGYLSENIELMVLASALDAALHRFETENRAETAALKAYRAAEPICPPPLQCGGAPGKHPLQKYASIGAPITEVNIPTLTTAALREAIRKERRGSKAHRMAVRLLKISETYDSWRAQVSSKYNLRSYSKATDDARAHAQWLINRIRACRVNGWPGVHIKAKAYLAENDITAGEVHPAIIRQRYDDLLQSIMIASHSC